MSLPYKKHISYPQLGLIKTTESDMYFIVADKRHELYRQRFGITNIKYDQDHDMRFNYPQSRIATNDVFVAWGFNPMRQ